MMTQIGFDSAVQTLNEMISQGTYQEDETVIFYGFCNGGYGTGQGWWMITVDYPAFSVFKMGETFQEAAAWAQETIDELADEEGDDDA